MRRWTIYGLLFGSGFSALVYELIWLRKFALVFGNTTYATSAVLVAFMGGLALGSHLLGKAADRVRDPLRLYGWLEAGIALSAVVIHYILIPTCQWLYIWFFQSVSQQIGVITLFRLVLSVLILLVPTLLMGGTLPMLSKIIAQQREHIGREVGRLYTVNTLGGVLGVFLTGFYLIRWFGELRSMWIAITVNALIAVTVFSLLRGLRPKADAQGPVLSLKKKLAQSRDFEYYLVLGVYAVSGFTALAYEVVWTRALIFYVSSTTYSFTIILATFLIGITLGSLLVSAVVDRLTSLRNWFAATQGVIALTALISIPLLNQMDQVHLWLFRYLHADNWTSVSLLLFATSFSILLIPTFCMGAAFPLVNRLTVRSLSAIGQGVGRVYLVNTLGTILGSLSAGFILLPLLGVSYSLLVLALCNLAAALVCIYFRPSLKISFAYGIGGILIWGVAFLLLAQHDGPLFTGIASYKNNRILYYKDGTTATIAALEKSNEINPWGRPVRLININGHNTAHTTYADIIIHKMLAHLPMLLHPNPAKALVIGFGFGNTCQSFLQYPIRQLDCVELVADERRTAAFFADENRGVFEDSRFRFLVNDGRNFISATRNEYDIISVNAVDPKFSPSLYTTEFYQLCYNKLSSDGMMVAWLPLYGMTDREVLSLIRSMVDVFPNTTLWYNNPEHLLLLGGKLPLRISVNQVKKRLSLASVESSLQQIFLDDPYAVLSTFMVDEDGLKTLVAGIEPHNDNNPVVEFSQVTLPILHPMVYQKILEQESLVLPLCEDVQADTATMKRIEAYQFAMMNFKRGLFAFRLAAAAHADSGQINPAIRVMRQAIERDPVIDFNLIFFLDWVSHQGELSSLEPLLHTAVQKAPRFAKAYVLLGLAHSQKAEWQTAQEWYQKALAIAPDFTAAHLNAALAYAQLQQWEEAAHSFERVVDLDSGNSFAHAGLAQIYYMMRAYDKAVTHNLTAIKLAPEQAPFYFNLGMIYEKQGNLRDAQLCFERGLKLAPDDSRAREMLQKVKARRNE